MIGAVGQAGKLPLPSARQGWDRGPGRAHLCLPSLGGGGRGWGLHGAVAERQIERRTPIPNPFPPGKGLSAANPPLQVGGANEFLAGPPP